MNTMQIFRNFFYIKNKMNIMINDLCILCLTRMLAEMCQVLTISNDWCFGVRAVYSEQERRNVKLSIKQSSSYMHLRLKQSK